MKYLLLCSMLFFSCMAHPVTKGELVLVCEVIYLTAIADHKEYIPYKVRQELVKTKKLDDICLLLITKVTTP